jgi:hypothetical protein
MTPETGHQTAVLNALAGGCCLTIDRLAEVLTGMARRQLTNAAARLIERGLVERVERGCFRLTGDGRAAQASGVVIKSGPRGPMQRKRPVRDSLNTRLWRAIRLRRKFTIPALLELAVRDETSPRHGAERFVRALERAGYLHRLPKREAGTSPTSNGHVRWVLVRDTGSLPPMPRRDGAVYDPNTGEVMPCTG